jgi:glycerol-3-phosphate dehydrogenase
VKYHRGDRITSAARPSGEGFDVCVIGGGATGAGCALDAQLRGLRTLLLEAADFGSGASTASTKMAHGGVRYLQEAVLTLDAKQYRLVSHSLHERRTMLRNAPHLTRPLEFVVPCWSRGRQLYYGIGVKAYDWIAGSERLIPSRFLSRKSALERLPVLHPKRTVAAVSYSDGQFDDARYNLALIRSFVAAGGVAINYASVTGFDHDHDGRLAGAQVEDRVSGESFRVAARAFVNATGPYSDNVRRLASPQAVSRMRPSKGVHVLFPLGAFPADTALLVPETEDGRVIFAIPWQGRLLVGTTDEAATPDASLTVTRAEVDYLLRQLNPYLEKPLRCEDVVAAFAGVRPLVASPDVDDTKTLIRDDEVEFDSASGLISILGGKWTTYRLMAERTINRVEQSLGRKLAACRTREYPLAGAQGYSADYWRTLTPRVPEPTARHLAAKYGTHAGEVLELISADESLGEPLIAGVPQIRAQVVYAIRSEMAETIEDILARRIGLQFHGWREAVASAQVTGEMLARESGWPAERVAAAVEEYRSGRIRPPDC